MGARGDLAGAQDGGFGASSVPKSPQSAAGLAGLGAGFGLVLVAPRGRSSGRAGIWDLAIESHPGAPPPNPGDWGQLGSVPPSCYLVAKPLFGADSGLHGLQESAQQLLKMIKSKEKHPKSLKSGEIRDPSSKDPLRGWSHLSPSPLDTHREDQSPLSHSHPPNLGYRYPNPLPALLPCGLLAPRSLRTGTGHGTGDSSSFILSLREVAPPGRWSSLTPAGSILPTAAPPRGCRIDPGPASHSQHLIPALGRGATPNHPKIMGKGVTPAWMGDSKLG